MPTKRVFILGAGFSKQGGLPLANELMPLLVEKAKLADHDEFRTWFQDFVTRVKDAEGAEDGDKLNFEQLFDFAMFDIELWRIRQQLEKVGRRYGNAAWDAADGMATWLGYVEEAIPAVFWEKQKEANLGSIKRFTKHLTEDDTVVTFNYDTLVERALCEQKKAWSHGFSLEETGGVTVLRMHGSIDWLLLKRRQEAELEKFIKLFSKADVNAPAAKEPAKEEAPGMELGLPDDGSRPEREHEYDWELWRAKDARVCGAVLDMDDCGLSNFDYRLGLAGLGHYKPLHRLAGSGETWVNAFKALKEAEEVYAVGFSMSPYDAMTRFHFASVIRARKTVLSKVVVVDPHASCLREAYRNVFNLDPTLEEKRAEEINWQKLLSQ